MKEEDFAKKPVGSIGNEVEEISINRINSEFRFKQFTKAAEEVEKIILLTNNDEIKAKLTTVGNDIEDAKTKKEFYRHMSSLFLNIILNRLDELGDDAEDRAIEARKIITNLIKDL